MPSLSKSARGRLGPSALSGGSGRRWPDGRRLAAAVAAARGRGGAAAPGPLRRGRHTSRVFASSGVPQEYVELAHKLADTAGAITSKYFRTPLDVECKGDESPVTIADKAAEQAMRELINATCPEHGVFGEEAGIDVRGGEYVWVLDPIDGTKSFITGKPLFGTLIALLKNGTPVLGVIDQCILKERWVGVAGEPSTLNGKVITTKPCASLGDAYMYSTTPFMFEGANLAPYNELATKVKIPMYGCDCYAYGLLAAGHCDLVVEADLKPYDFMALVPVIEGAGGIVTDWNGDRVGLDPATLKDGASEIEATEIIAACDAGTHRAALDVLQAVRAAQ